MGRILAVSSQVVRGHVGLSAIVPALQGLDHEVLPVPTILLSNHPGHARAAGTRIEVNTLMSMLDVLELNGWLTGIDAVLTGYLPSPEHVDFAIRAIDTIRKHSPHTLVVVDPVLGDDPRGLYIDVVAAARIRADLVPKADLITPNRFELSWLSGHEVQTPTDVRPAARKLGVGHVLATSVPVGSEALANVAATASTLRQCRVRRRPNVPHGTGDLLSALMVGHRLRGGDLDEALGKAVAGVEVAITASAGRDDLTLARAADGADWTSARSLPVETL